MKRRAFIMGVAGAAAAWPLAGRSQPAGGKRRIAVLVGLAETDSDMQAGWAAFERELQTLGWTRGREMEIEYRWAAGDPVRTREYAEELVARQPSVIVTHGSPALIAVGRNTRTIPVVFTVVTDPVSTGLVASLTNPGGNVTGFSNLEPTLPEKWLQILQEFAPATKRVLVLLVPEIPFHTQYLQRTETIAQHFGFEIVGVPVHGPADIERALSAEGATSASALIVLPDPANTANSQLIVDLALRYGMPGVYPRRAFAADGGLVSYGTNQPDIIRRAATYVDHILRGTSPRDLPVQQPNKFDFVINAKTAKALGLKVPLSLLASADEVLE